MAAKVIFFYTCLKCVSMNSTMIHKLILKNAYLVMIHFQRPYERKTVIEMKRKETQKHKQKYKPQIKHGYCSMAKHSFGFCDKRSAAFNFKALF